MQFKPAVKKQKDPSLPKNILDDIKLNLTLPGFFIFCMINWELFCYSSEYNGCPKEKNLYSVLVAN
jgi:hypothetical protein